MSSYEAGRKRGRPARRGETYCFDCGHPACERGQELCEACRARRARAVTIYDRAKKIGQIPPNLQALL